MSQDSQETRLQREELKKLGNSHFKETRWVEAVKEYTKGIALGKCMELSKADNRVQAILFSNRAAARIQLSEHALAVADANAALKCDPSYTKAMYRLAQGHEGLGVQLGVTEGGVHHLEQSLVSLTKLMRLQPKNKDVVGAAQRVRMLVAKKREEAQSAGPYIAKLKLWANEEDETLISKQIRMVMGLLVNKETARPSILAAHFAGQLLEIVLKSQSESLRPVATRALTTMVGSPKRYGLPKEDIKLLRGSLPQLIRTVHDLKLKASVHSAETHKDFRTLIVLLSRVACHPKLNSSRQGVLGCLLQCMSLPDKTDYDDPKNLRLLASVGATLQGIAVFAHCDESARAMVRKLVLPSLLFSRVAKCSKLRRSLLACLAVVAGNKGIAEQDSADLKEDKMDRMNKKLGEKMQQMAKKAGGDKAAPAPAKPELSPEDAAAKKFKNEVTQLACAPLFVEDDEANMQAANALALILQAHPDLGIEVVKTEFARTGPKGERIKSLFQSAAEAAREDAELNGEEVPEVKEEDKQENKGVSPLQMLIIMSTEEGEKLRFAAAEVLAMCSSDLAIRGALASSGNVQLLVELLECPQWLTRTHAALAVAKMQAVGTVELTDIQHEALLATLLEVMTLFASQNKTKQADDLEGDVSEEELISRYVDSDAVPEVDGEALRHVVESLAYLSLNIKSKKIIASKNAGAWFQTILDFGASSDKAVRYGFGQIVLNMTTSKEDLERDYDREVEELRKIASKGLKNQQQTKQDLANKAGTVKAISIIRKIVVKSGAVASMVKCAKRYQEAYTAPTEPVPEKKQTTAGFARSQKKIKRKTEELPYLGEKAAEAFARALFHMASETANRGRMVQHGALKLLPHLYTAYKGEKTKLESAVAMARIAITTNPNLFNQGACFSLVLPLLETIRECPHELYEFECAMALTNLASIDQEVAERMVSEGAWTDLGAMLSSSDNPQVQRAAVECMTNLATCPTSLERLRGDAGEMDIRYFLIFSQVDDIKTQCAATGALAMIAFDPEIGRRILDCEIHSTLTDEVDEEGKPVEVHRTGMGILEGLLLDENTHPDVRKRVEVCMEQLAGHNYPDEQAEGAEEQEAPVEEEQQTGVPTEETPEVD